MDKTQLRSIIREQKRNMTPEQIDSASHELSEKLMQTECWNTADTVYLYISINQEVRTARLISSALKSGKKVAVPLVVGDEIVFKYISSHDDLHSGYWNVPEPDESCITADDKDALVIMPGLAFDSEGYRLGYGKGFYDRFLSREPEHHTIALCYGFQLVDSVPHELHDRVVNEIISVKT